MSETIRLNVGAGGSVLPGYIPIDCKDGGEAWPLRYNDGSEVQPGTVDEIYASHVLQHASHNLVPAILSDWARALKPDGVLKLAVPDFDKCIAARANGSPLPIQEIIFGKQESDDDCHGAMFDETNTRKMLRAAGFRHLRRWKSQHEDGAASPLSLNLEGVKADKPDCRDTIAVMSVPRLGFTDNFRCATTVLPPLGIRITTVNGVFWQKTLSVGIQSAIEQGAKYILTLDYDTVFRQEHVEDLVRLLDTTPEADAISPIQAMRGKKRMLAHLADANWNPMPRPTPADLEGELTPLLSAHFGLTLFRAEAFAKMPKPWFLCTPDANGEWGETSIDSDINFWRQWRAMGLKLYQANHVVVGHAELMVSWPDERFYTIHQYPDDFAKHGPPSNARF